MKKSKTKRAAGSSGPSVHGMEAELGHLAGRLMVEFRKQYPGEDQYRFRDMAARVFQQALTQKIKRKPRGESEITKAERMWRQQLAGVRRGTKKRVYWVLIAAECYSDFGLLPESDRRRRLRRLKNAVHNRNYRAGKRGKRARKKRAVAHRLIGSSQVAHDDAETG